MRPGGPAPRRPPESCQRVWARSKMAFVPASPRGPSCRVASIVVPPEMRAGDHAGRCRVEVDVFDEGERGILRVSRFRAGRRG